MWWSHPAPYVQHSSDLRLNPNVAINVLNSAKNIGSVAFSGEAREIPVDELREALLVFNGLRRERRLPELDLTDFLPNDRELTRRLFIARLTGATVPVGRHIRVGNRRGPAFDGSAPVPVEAIFDNGVLRGR
jgi:hypothetical protein